MLAKNWQNISGAIQDYDTAIRLNPHNVLAYHNRGNARKAIKDFEGAIWRIRQIAYYTEVIRLNPNYADAYYNRSALI